MTMFSYYLLVIVVGWTLFMLPVLLIRGIYLIIMHSRKGGSNDK